MSDRTKLGCFLLAVSLIVLGYSLASYQVRQAFRSSKPPVQGPRNVYVITATGLRADHLDNYGYQPIQTPQMDYLAQDGIRFKHAITNSPQSLPAHVSLLTGLYPFRDDAQQFLRKQRVPSNLPQIFRAKGYKTAAILADPDLQNSPLTDLFENVQRPQKSPEVTRDALNWIAAHSADRQFVLINYDEPTFPFDPPFPYNHHYKNYPYDGETAALDEQIGILSDGLQKRGLYRRSVIVFASPFGSDLNGAVTDGSIRQDMLGIPLYVVAQGLLPEYQTYENQVSLVDVLPTVLMLLNITRPQTQLDGLPLFQRGSRNEIYRELIFGSAILPDQSLQYFAHNQSGNVYVGSDAQEKITTETQRH